MTDKELFEIRGGINIGLIGLIGGILTFFIGVIDGYMRPLKCN